MPRRFRRGAAWKRPLSPKHVMLCFAFLLAAVELSSHCWSERTGTRHAGERQGGLQPPGVVVGGTSEPAPDASGAGPLPTGSAAASPAGSSGSAQADSYDALSPSNTAWQPFLQPRQLPSPPEVGEPPLVDVVQQRQLATDRVAAAASQRIWVPALPASGACLRGAALSYQEAKDLLLAGIEEQPALQANVSSLPCSESRIAGLDSWCCQQPMSWRYNTSDILVFDQVYNAMFLQSLYTLFERHEPQSILDAGGNVGYTTMLFKLLWPNATVVVLEPDPNNFAMLQRNTLGKVLHFWHLTSSSGLWSHHANSLVFTTGAWGNVFTESEPGQPGMEAYSIQDIVEIFNISGGVDFVKLDVEGAEAMVFAPHANVSWIMGADIVVLEVHDSFAHLYGLKEIGSRVEAAFANTGYEPVLDHEHILFLSPRMLDLLPSDAPIFRAK